MSTPAHLPVRSRRALATLAAVALAGCSGGSADQPNAAESSGGGAPQASAAAAPSAPPAAAARKPPAPAMPEVDPANVNASLVYDAAAKTLKMPNVSGLTSNAGGWNFDGYANGDATLVIPLGTTVEMEYYNADAHPHSVGIVEGKPTAIPSAPGGPAFANAISTKYQVGMAAGQRDLVRFTADKPGSYLMVCGVPGHAVGGMWIKVEVSRTAKTPAFRS